MWKLFAVLLSSSNVPHNYLVENCKPYHKILQGINTRIVIKLITFNRCCNFVVSLIRILCSISSYKSISWLFFTFFAAIYLTIVFALLRQLLDSTISFLESNKTLLSRGFHQLVYQRAINTAGKKFVSQKFDRNLKFLADLRGRTVLPINVISF